MTRIPGGYRGGTGTPAVPPRVPFACSTASATSAMFTWSNPPGSSRRLTGQPPAQTRRDLQDRQFATRTRQLAALQALDGALPVDSGGRLIAGRFRIGLLMHEPAGEILTTDPAAVAQHELNCGLLDTETTRASPQHRDQPHRRRRRRPIPSHTDHPPYVASDAKSSHLMRWLGGHTAQEGKTARSATHALSRPVASPDTLLALNSDVTPRLSATQAPRTHTVAYSHPMQLAAEGTSERPVALSGRVDLPYRDSP